MTKAALRKEFKAKRASLSNSQRNEWSQKICDQLMARFDLEDKKVSIFLPIERFHEVNTWQLIDRLKATFVLPVLNGDQLKHIVFEGMEQIKVSDWGIPEPQYGEEIKAADIDKVIVPLLAIDEQGYRVGYGKGFYDGFLKDCRDDCEFIGVSFYPPIEKIEDVHEADIPLHYCVTPNTIYKFKTLDQ